MTRALLASIAGLSLSVGISIGAELHDTHDLEAVHAHIKAAIKDMEQAAAANHYDMSGHAKKAESALHEAETELRAAVESARAGH